MNQIQEIESLKTRLTDLQRQVERLSNHPLNHPGSPVRLAKVSYTGSPPVDGQNFEIEFQNGTYTKAGGAANNPTFTPRQTNKEWCSNVVGDLPANGQDVITFWFSGRWWSIVATNPENKLAFVQAKGTGGEADLDVLTANANCVFSGKTVTHNVAENMCTAGLTEGVDVWFVRNDQILNEEIRHNVVYNATKIGQHTEGLDTRDLYALRGTQAGTGDTFRKIEIQHPSSGNGKYYPFKGDSKCLFTGKVGSWSLADDTSYCSDSPFTSGGDDVWVFVGDPARAAILKEDGVYNGKLLGQYSDDGGTTYRDIYSVFPHHGEFTESGSGSDFLSIQYVDDTEVFKGFTSGSFAPISLSDFGITYDNADGTFSITKTSWYRIGIHFLYPLENSSTNTESFEFYCQKVSPVASIIYVRVVPPMITSTPTHQRSGLSAEVLGFAMDHVFLQSGEQIHFFARVATTDNDTEAYQLKISKVFFERL